MLFYVESLICMNRMYWTNIAGFVILFVILAIFPRMALAVCTGTDNCKNYDGCTGSQYCSGTSYCCESCGYTCTSCSKTCGGGTRTCSSSHCGTYTQDCNTQACPVDTCSNTNPNSPEIVTPISSQTLTINYSTLIDWNTVSSWGTNCNGNTDTYTVCVDGGNGSCDEVNQTYTKGSGITQYSWTPSVKGNRTVKLTADNGAKSSFSSVNVCVEGGPYTTWTACDSFHKTVQTTTYDCSPSVPGEAVDCVATIQGTLFDATNLDACPADIGTNVTYDSLRIKNKSFGLSGTWPVITSPVATDLNGNYSESVYASSVFPNYTYDYSSLISAGVVDSVKFECQSSIVAAMGNGLTYTKDTGFYVNQNVGWWQVTGGSVTTGGNIFSTIPNLGASARLILPDANGRDGLLSVVGTEYYGSGSLSDSNNRYVQNYAGSVYDYAYFASKWSTIGDTWTAQTWPAYTTEDTTKGYKLLKYTEVADLNLAGGVINSGEKYIVLANGNVNINGTYTVADGGFLSVIAKGTIKFDPTAVDSEGVNRFDGWYLGQILDLGTTGSTSTEQQFVGQGSFVSWSQMVLNRDRGVLNSTAPSEKFIYRTDLLENAPEIMKEPYKHYERYNP